MDPFMDLLTEDNIPIGNNQRPIQSTTFDGVYETFVTYFDLEDDCPDGPTCGWQPGDEVP